MSEMGWPGLAELRVMNAIAAGRSTPAKAAKEGGSASGEVAREPPWARRLSDQTSKPASARQSSMEVPRGWKPKRKLFIP